MRFIAPAVAVLYVGAIMFALGSCDHFSCRGTQFDAFLPAFGLSPFGVPALAYWFYATVRKIRNRRRAPGSWILAIVLGALLAGIVGFFVYLFVFL